MLRPLHNPGDETLVLPSLLLVAILKSLVDCRMWKLMARALAPRGHIEIV